MGRLPWSSHSKDGHQQTFSMSDVARVEYVGATDAYLAPEYFLGNWEVGDGSGTFLITLESNGEASKTLGASHGIWTVERNEAASTGTTAGMTPSAK
jgi:hypothetical protein